MSTSQNYYTILQVKPDADLETIKRAYRKKIRRYHPDQLAAALSEAKRSGTRTEFKTLEREITRAKQTTQRINEAYAVLSDEDKRAAYDGQLSYERQLQYREEVRRQRMRHYEDGRRTVKSRPHHRNPNIRRKPQQGKGVPWIMLIVLIIGVMVVSGLFSQAVTRSYTPVTNSMPRNPTSEGIMRARDLQATTNAEQVTEIARSTIVFDPTSTPRSSSQNEDIGDQFLRLERPQQAIDAYTDAIIADLENPTLYLKRAEAYFQLYLDGDAEAILSALDDYTEAIRLDGTFAEAYLGRGIVYYELSPVEYAENARADLDYYLELNPDGDNLEIQLMLDDLP